MSNLKKTLAIVLALMMVLALLAGCGSKQEADGGKDTTPSGGSDTSGKPASEGSEAEKPDSGNADANADRVLNIATSGDTGTLYPLAASGGFVSLEFAFYEPLWTLTSTGEKVMKLAESYEPVGTDNVEFTLKIREGVQFSNGNPFTADDVMFSMEMCKDDPRFNLNVVKIDFTKTNVVDDLTLDVWYTDPSYTQDNAFTQLMIMDKESFNIEELSQHPVGTGPWR